MGTISLQNFSSIFEILSVYYIGSATSDKFKSFFGINETFGTALSKNAIFKILKIIQLDKLEIEGAITTSRLEEEAETAAKRAKIMKCLAEIGKLNTKRHYYFEDSILFRCLRPFYVLFGIMAFGMLIFSGTLEAWHKQFSLVLINLISLLAIGILIFKLYGLSPNKKYWGSIKSFGFSFILITVLIALPEKLLAHYTANLLPANAINNRITTINYTDFHIMLNVILLITPLLIHMICLISVMVKVYLIKNKLVKNGVMLSTLEEQQEELSHTAAEYFSDFPDLKSQQDVGK